MKLRIIIIEDEPDVSELLEDWLKEDNPWHEFKAFFNAASAFEFFQQELNKPPDMRALPHLIILDIRLPDQSGLEVLKKIKTTPELKSIEIIVNTASDDPEHLCRAHRYGSCVFIRKADGRTAVLEAIQRLKTTGRVTGDKGKSKK